MNTVTIADAPLTVADVVRVATGARVELGPSAFARIDESRAVVEQALASGRPVYGLNTGLGSLKDVRVPDEELRRYQEITVALHAGGIGAPLSTEVVRAAMFARVTGIARGGSGATRGVAETLVAMLNAGVHPIVPTVGSVGAADLMHMAAIALVAIGQGRAEHRGEVLDGAEALARAGIAPARLEPKDGLALISANGVAIGHAALVVARASQLAEVADVVAAVTIEALRGNPSIVEPAVAVAKPVPGQIEAARHLRQLLEGSDLYGEGVPRSIQDPLSLRVVPQVHGALRELIGFARGAVETELNAMDDNPLVSREERRMIHTGNFHPMLLALALDGLRPALAHAGLISDRRLEHLWAAFIGEAETITLGRMEQVTEAPIGLFLRYAAAAALAELKIIAAPATLDIPPLDRGTEDHATAAPLAVRRTDEALDLLEGILAVELLTARDVLGSPERRPRLGTGTASALGALDELLARRPRDRDGATIHDAVGRFLREFPSGPVSAS